MSLNDIDVNIESNPSKGDNRHLLSATFSDEEQEPVQKNTDLFKFILYTSKIEIKLNSLMNMIYSNSMSEIGIWFIGLILFLFSSKTLYLIWILIIHVARGIFGLIILSTMPKTYEVIENLYQKDNIDEKELPQMIKDEIKGAFMKRWADNKNKLFWYFIVSISCIVVDLIILIVQIVLFGNETYFIMETCMMLIMIIFLSMTLNI